MITDIQQVEGVKLPPAESGHGYLLLNLVI